MKSLSKTIRKLTPFDSVDLTAAEEYFSDMASKGWIIKKYSLISEFERCEPMPLRFNVQLILPEKKGEDYAHKIKGYTELCEEAGWRLACSNSGMFIFFTEREDIPDIVTDPNERIATVKKQSTGGMITAWILPFLSILPVMGLVSNLICGKSLSPSCLMRYR